MSSQSQYDLRITPAAQKEIEGLPKQARERVETAILSLPDEPRPRGSKKLRGLKNTHRIRVGNYRVVYQVHDDVLVILIIAVGDRKDIYGG